uniref:UBIQUITIN_CONJUGAT_2 domain-containing protein n=1 Tax=Macrostomum lignano TaxID=282301 RepID=A0A1I8ISW8_9PLAT
ENYPRVAPLWFSDSDNQLVTSALSDLQDCPATPAGSRGLLLLQACQLLETLCRTFGLPVPLKSPPCGPPPPPPRLPLLEPPPLPPQWPCPMRKTPGSRTSMMTSRLPRPAPTLATARRQPRPPPQGGAAAAGDANAADEDLSVPAEFAGIESRAHIDQLRRLRSAQRDMYLRRSVSSPGNQSPAASPAAGNAAASANPSPTPARLGAGYGPVDERAEGAVQRDIEQLAQQQQQAGQQAVGITLGFYFKDTFPFEPPFVRVISPVLNNGYVLQGGAICMEVLTRQGWSSAYSIESLIMQISATLVKGKARIEFSASSRSTYTMARAQHSYRALVNIHEKKG